MEPKNRSRVPHSEATDSLNFFSHQFEEGKKQEKDHSAGEIGKSVLSADDEDKYFFLNFIQSAESSQDEHSAVQSNYQPRIQSTRTLSEICDIHKMPYVAFCAVHQELVCEDCTDSEKHIEHNDKILLLKAAALDIINKISIMTKQLSNNDKVLSTCLDFKLKQSFRKMISEFFEYLHEKLRELEQKKMDELQTFFINLNWEDVSRKAEFLKRRQGQMNEYVQSLKDAYTSKKFTKIIEQSSDIKDQMESISFHQQEIAQLVKDYEKQKNIELVRKNDDNIKELEKVVNDSIRIPNVSYITEKRDNLHFFVYNSHCMYKYNIKSGTYEASKIGVKIPANFMSIETEDGKIFISGGGEPGKAKKACYEFIDNGLVPKTDMLYERRAHTLTETKDQNHNSLIYAVGSSLPTESMDKCEYYDIRTNSWTAGPALNTKRNFHSTIAFKQRYIYVMAGFNGGQRTNMIERLDTFFDTEWSIVNVKMQNHSRKWVCLEGCGLYSIDHSKILIFGGYTSSERKSRDCFFFFPDSEEIEKVNCKTACEANFYQRQPKLSSEGDLYCVETNSLDIHVFNTVGQKWSVISRKTIGW